MPAEREPHLTYKDFTGAVGDYLGYGWGAHNDDRAWSVPQNLNITKVVGSGQRMVYYPEPLFPNESAHSWSFLRPTTTLTLESGASEVLLPRDCGSQLEGDILHFSSNRTGWAPLRLTSWGAVRQLAIEGSARTGLPQAAAIEPVKMTGTEAEGGQRWRLLFFPTADADVTLRLTYQVIPEMLTEARPFHYGGPQHSETFLAAVIAAAELFRDNKRAERWQYFVSRLTASIHLDRRSRPQVLGYNGDSSDIRWGGAAVDGRRLNLGQPVTIGGLTPE